MWSVALQGCALALTMATGVILARALGPAEYGAWAISLAAATSLGTIAALGLPNLLMRRVAEHNSKREWNLLSSTLSRSIRLSTASSLLIALVALAVAWLWRGEGAVHFILFAIAVAALPLTTLTNAWGAALRGLGHGVVAQAVPTLLRPFVLLVGVGTAALLLSVRTDAAFAMTMNLAGAFAALIGTFALYRRFRPAEVAMASTAQPIAGLWQECMPFMLVTMMGAVSARVDLFLIGALLDSHAAGLYEVAYRGADLVLLPLTATTAVIGPEYARRFALKDHRGLQKLVTQSTRGLVLLSAPIALCLIVFAGPIIRLIFGTQYAEGAGAMAVLSGGSLLMLVLGPVHVLLGMTGRSRTIAVGAFVGIGLGALLSVALIPRFGIEGAAAGRSIGQWLASGWLSWLALREIGIRTWALQGIKTP